MFRRVVEAFAALMLLVSLYALYHCLNFLGNQDYVAAVLLAAVGLGLMRSGVELARSSIGR
ncbi:MAG: hypothetical protein KJ558_17045 [Gammaproteobacteria bacterium]|jgi:hypothetical protein|nr:hypothetical protein [Gammaproteobacteria bacterium]